MSCRCLRVYHTVQLLRICLNIIYPTHTHRSQHGSLLDTPHTHTHTHTQNSGITFYQYVRYFEKPINEKN